jgi:hypothetical protein
MIYGMQVAKDIKLSNITRALHELIPLIKTEDRLSRNLDDEEFKEICRLRSAKVAEDMVIDPGGNPANLFNNNPPHYFSLRPESESVNYLDIAVEYAGYVYVLSCGVSTGIYTFITRTGRGFATLRM